MKSQWYVLGGSFESFSLHPDCNASPEEVQHSLGYLMKYIEKSGERLIYGGKLPTYFESDVMDDHSPLYEMRFLSPALMSALCAHHTARVFASLPPLS